MSWSGTVTCSHCYQQGHNKRACPQLTQELKQAYNRQVRYLEEYRAMTDEELESRGEDREWNINYHENRAEKARVAYLKRTKIDLATGKKVTNKVAKAERMKKVTCGYCGQKGHTRRVCQNAKNDYAIYVERTRQVRLEWYEKFKATGMGIGSMVVGQAHGYNSNGEWGRMTVTALVTGVDWKKISAHNPDNRVIVLRTNAALKGDNRAPRLDNLSLQAIDSPRDSQTLMPSGAIPPMPDDYLTDMNDIKEVFKTSQERAWAYTYAGDDDWRTTVRKQLGIPTCAYSKCGF